MRLKHTKETIISVDSHDLESFIMEEIGVEYDFIQASECRNDSSHRFHVDGTEMHLNEDAWDFMQGNKHAAPKAVLFALINKGLIPPGIYAINVCW